MIDIDSYLCINPFTIHRDSKENAALFGILQVPSTRLTECADNFLSESERVHFLQLEEKQQINFLMGRILTKRMLSEYFAEPNPKRIVLKNGVFGQPIIYYKHPVLQSPGISLSHTPNIAVVILFPEDHIMGIDIEIYEQNDQYSIDTQITHNEKGLFKGQEGISNFYTRIWTIKEALSKTIKTGLMIPFSILEVQMITYFEMYSISIFTNFPQYKAISFAYNNAFISIVLPKNSHVNTQTLIGSYNHFT